MHVHCLRTSSGSSASAPPACSRTARDAITACGSPKRTAWAPRAVRRSVRQTWGRPHAAERSGCNSLAQARFPFRRSARLGSPGPKGIGPRAEGERARPCCTAHRPNRASARESGRPAASPRASCGGVWKTRRHDVERHEAPDRSGRRRGPAFAPWAGGFFGAGLLPGLFVGSMLGGTFGCFGYPDAAYGGAEDPVGGDFGDFGGGDFGGGGDF